MFHRKTFLFLATLLFLTTSSSILFSQEKKSFLQNRFNSFTKIITKDFTDEKLNNLKDELATIGIQFTYENLKFNADKEIIHITIEVKNKKGNSKITIDDLTPIPNITISEAFGFTSIVANKTIDFNPTEIQNITYKESNNSQEKPLYIIDGKEVSEVYFKNLDVKMVESIFVLKGASAIKVYGSKGKNGVVLITTKKE